MNRPYDVFVGKNCCDLRQTCFSNRFRKYAVPHQHPPAGAEDQGIGIEPVFVSVPNFTPGTIPQYGVYPIRIELNANLSLPPFSPQIIITKNGFLMIQGFTTDQISATANGPGTIYVDSTGALKVVQ